MRVLLPFMMIVALLLVIVADPDRIGNIVQDGIENILTDLETAIADCSHPDFDALNPGDSQRYVRQAGCDTLLWQRMPHGPTLVIVAETAGGPVRLNWPAGDAAAPRIAPYITAFTVENPATSGHMAEVRALHSSWTS